MIRFLRYKNSYSLGTNYIIGFNVYRNEPYADITIDLILGKHVFVAIIGYNK